MRSFFPYKVCTVQKAQYFPDLMSRERIAYMNEIVHPIPSNLFVDLTQCYLYNPHAFDVETLNTTQKNALYQDLYNQKNVTMQ